MKHQPPKVEDYNSENATPNPPPSTEKRKRDSKNYKQSQEQTPELEVQQPPNKTAKSEAPAEDGDTEEPEYSEEPEEPEDDVEDGEEYEDFDEGDEGDEGQGEEDEDEGEENQQHSTVNEPKAHKVIEEFGLTPLDRTPLAKETLTAAPETILAMAIDAMLKSRPISHDLTQRTVSHIIEIGYHDIGNLRNSSWDERTMVLKDGGYNRYREQGATNLGNLVDLVDGKYGMFESIVLNHGVY